MLTKQIHNLRTTSGTLIVQFRISDNVTAEGRAQLLNSRPVTPVLCCGSSRGMCGMKPVKFLQHQTFSLFTLMFLLHFCNWKSPPPLHFSLTHSSLSLSICLQSPRSFSFSLLHLLVPSLSHTSLDHSDYIRRENQVFCNQPLR